MAAKSPLMEQYKSIKNEHKDAFLFYRLGDFYELFYDDAVTVSHELELTLTGKNAGPEGIRIMRQKRIFTGLYRKAIRLPFVNNWRIQKKRKA